MKEKVIAVYENLKQGASADLQKRLGFEQRIKRPYFHVKPLDPSQLSNWRAYLDFEEQQGDKVNAMPEQSASRLTR